MRMYCLSFIFGMIPVLDMKPLGADVFFFFFFFFPSLLPEYPLSVCIRLISGRQQSTTVSMYMLLLLLIILK